MEFTYKWYINLVDIINNSYQIKSWNDTEDGVIIRHDIDYDLKKAYEFAKLEKELGIRNTYFLLLSSDFYNVFSEESAKYIEGIMECGHEIGLHFDEKRYGDNAEKEFLVDKIQWEARVLSELAGESVDVVSMHRPSERMLEWDLEIPNMVNTYSREFFDNYKYVSDSRRRWREDVKSVIQDKEYKNIQILIHPFWYADEENVIHDAIADFVNRANVERYDCLDRNITDLYSIMKREEVN